MTIAALCLSCLSATAHDELDPDHVNTALAALQGAKSVAVAGRGTLLAVGSLLATDTRPSDSVLVLSDVKEKDFKPGMVLIVEKLGCRGQESCLLARRVTSAAGETLETDPYPTIEGLLVGEVKASLIGAVAYAVDLNTNTIEDLRSGQPERVSFEDAIAQEHQLMVAR